MNKSLLVVVAHPGDFVWRAAGAILIHRAAGWSVKVVCLTLGIKGEAGKLWKEEGANYVHVQKTREAETREAAKSLGAELEILHLDDYPLEVDKDVTIQLNKIIRVCRPDVILTHSPIDPGNVDHANTCEMVIQARTFASAPGYGADMVSPPSLFHFEPHQPELCDFKADTFLDITSVWRQKKEAFQKIQSQQGVWDYYERVALQRGTQASRRSSHTITHAEAFQRAGPAMVKILE
ncbi:PIG-L domain-containing protein [Advenella sp. S44]|uniref:PIG-L deacetylase family protein n=1 Tax=Advenella sp. S44 TaxID=1982755 RepID=UPI000C296AC7|nr:PIG-L deacetylase family protein [Advenella sp. S44]PJX27977.1 PIG-L domain-containing protein [Advenella sp. S44]